MQAGVLFVKAGSASSWRTQIVYDQGGHSFYRNIYESNSSYNSPWVCFSTDIPDFYKDYGTLNALATALGVRGTSTWLKYYDVEINKPNNQITDDDIKAAIYPYMNGDNGNSEGISLLQLKSIDGARRSFIVSQDGVAYASAICFSWYDDSSKGIRCFRLSNNSWEVYTF